MVDDKLARIVSDDVLLALADAVSYLDRRTQEVDVDSSDLDGLDMSSPAFQIAMRHGMATAYHEMWHWLDDYAEKRLRQG